MTPLQRYLCESGGSANRPDYCPPPREERDRTAEASSVFDRFQGRSLKDLWGMTQQPKSGSWGDFSRNPWETFKRPTPTSVAGNVAQAALMPTPLGIPMAAGRGITNLINWDNRVGAEEELVKRSGVVPTITDYNTFLQNVGGPVTWNQPGASVSPVGQAWSPEYGHPDSSRQGVALSPAAYVASIEPPPVGSIGQQQVGQPTSLLPNLIQEQFGFSPATTLELETERALRENRFGASPGVPGGFGPAAVPVAVPDISAPVIRRDPLSGQIVPVSRNGRDEPEPERNFGAERGDVFGSYGRGL
jgi:hypothetical protein